MPIVRYPPSERKKNKLWKDMDLNDIRWFQWPKQAPDMVKYVESLSGEDVSTTVAVCKNRSYSKSSIPELKVIHCEADGAEPGRFALQPSLIVETSPQRYQLYWILKDPIPRAKAEPVAKAVAYSQREWGADMGWSANKLLRVPGTTNTKPAYDKPKVTAEFTGRIYTLKELKKAFKPTEEMAKANLRPFPSSLPHVSDVLNKIRADAEFMKLYQEPATPTNWNPQGSRYKVLYKLACRLFREGLEADEVYVVCANCASNKYEQDGRAKVELWRDVLKAEAEVSLSDIIIIEGEFEGEQRKFHIEQGRVQLLTEEERTRAENYQTFIETYTGWAKTRTKLADPQYHVSNAIALLSTIFGEYGYAVPQHGSMPLEVWFMILGVTTRSHKTTAARLMLEVIREIEQARKVQHKEREQPYRIAQNITPEALADILAKRGDISSLFHVDEAHGLLRSERGAKGYMSGTSLLLTQLYDGWVPATERMTRAGNPSVRTHLTMHLMGVPDRMIEILDREDFRSGFLARFIFVLGQPAQETRENMRLEQSDPTKPRDWDAEMAKMAVDLATSMGRLDSVVARKPDGYKIPVVVSDKAWDRWNDLTMKLDEVAEQSEDFEAALPTARRTGNTVHRVACLLALAEGKTVVSLNHMLKAIYFAEQWVTTMLVFIQLVHRNQWARQVHELIEYIITKGGQLSWQQTYSRFNNYKPREFSELVDSAVQSGRVKLMTAAGKSTQIKVVQ